MPDYENRNQAVASLGEYLSTKPGGIVCFPQRSDPKKIKRASFIPALILYLGNISFVSSMREHPWLRLEVATEFNYF